MVHELGLKPLNPVEDCKEVMIFGHLKRGYPVIIPNFKILVIAKA